MLRGMVFVLGIVLSGMLWGCGGPGGNGLRKKNAHEAYRDKLVQLGLDGSAMGQLWITAAGKALQQPVPVSLPYREQGYFSQNRPGASGYRITVQEGQKLLVKVVRQGSRPYLLFADLWKPGPSPEWLQSIDTATLSLEYDAEETEELILRVQPELLASGSYELSLSIGPSLGFPVSGAAARVGSIWGDQRDAGARRHEGIDIFAPRRTPVVAAADGRAVRVNENRLGGKVVWMRPEGKDYTLYYAHLDEQWVQDGDPVKKGDTLGLVGNTGNARSTPPHLHFGIYRSGGAVNPLPYVSREVKTAPAPASLFREGFPYRLNRETVLSVENRAGRYAAGTLVLPVALTARAFRVQLPDGMEGIVAAADLVPAQRPLRRTVIKEETFLLDEPSGQAARIRKLADAAGVEVLAYFGSFAYVRFAEEEGWIARDRLS